MNDYEKWRIWYTRKQARELREKLLAIKREWDSGRRRVSPPGLPVDNRKINI